MSSKILPVSQKPHSTYLHERRRSALQGHQVFLSNDYHNLHEYEQNLKKIKHQRLNQLAVLLGHAQHQLVSDDQLSVPLSLLEIQDFSRHGAQWVQWMSGRFKELVQLLASGKHIHHSIIYSTMNSIHNSNQQLIQEIDIMVNTIDTTLEQLSTMPPVQKAANETSDEPDDDLDYDCDTESELVQSPKPQILQTDTHGAENTLSGWAYRRQPKISNLFAGMIVNRRRQFRIIRPFPRLPIPLEAEE